MITRTSLALIVCILIGQSLGSSFFNPRLSHAPRFTGDQLFPVSQDVHVDNIAGYIGCYGDFNSDKYTDIFVINSAQTNVSIYLWSTDLWAFGSAFQTINPGISITNIAAADFNSDGKLDLLIQGKNSTSPEVNQIQIWLGDYQTLYQHTSLQTTSVGQVIIAELNGDMFPDLFGAYTSPTDRTTWFNTNAASSWTITPQGTGLAPLKTDAHSNAFVDINGDCQADLVVTTTSSNPDVPSFEIWLGKSGVFQLDERYKAIPGVAGMGQILFEDFDGDGSVDVLFPVCYPAPNCTTENSIHIIYNKQQTVCASSLLGGTGCRKDTALCTADDNYTFQSFNSPAGADVVIIANGTLPNSLYKSPFLPGGTQIHVADLNLDRFPDLLVPFQGPNGTYVEIWMSTPCTMDGCGQDAFAAFRRTFVPTPQDLRYHIPVNNAIVAAPFSFDEAGRNDLFVLTQTVDPHTQKPSFAIDAVFNNWYNDAFFLKVLGLNGVCTIGCPITSVPEPKPYGVNQYGATFKFSMTDLYGTSETGTVVQLSQSSYLSLQTPYAVAGLARPSNYVEFLWFGVPLKNDKKEASRSWPGVMPNSQVVASPYPMDDPSSWLLELYISPSGVTLWVIIAVVAWLIVLGAVVIGLHWREKKQDEKEKKEKEHLFSFKAM